MGSPVRSVCAALSLSLMLRGSAGEPTKAGGHAGGGHDEQPLAVLVELQDAAHLDAERRHRRRHRLGHERVEVVALEREAADVATAFCWRARRASCCAAWVRSVMSRATTSSGLDGSVAGADGHRLDGERQALARELEGAPLTLQRGAVVLEAELEDLVGYLGVQLGHLASAEHVLVEEPEAPDRLAVGDEDTEFVIEEEDRGVRQVGGEGPVQRLGVADPQLGLARVRSRRFGGRSCPSPRSTGLRPARPSSSGGADSRRRGCDSCSRRRPRSRRRAPRGSRSRERVDSTSSGWTNEMNGSAISSSRVQPSQRSHAGFSSVKYPSVDAVPSMSSESSKSRCTASGDGRFAFAGHGGLPPTPLRVQHERMRKCKRTAEH